MHWTLTVYAKSSSMSTSYITRTHIHVLFNQLSVPWIP